MAKKKSKPKSKAKKSRLKRKPKKEPALRSGHFVRYSGTHGSKPMFPPGTGRSYDFIRDVWHDVDERDFDYFMFKAKNNPNTWHAKKRLGKTDPFRTIYDLQHDQANQDMSKDPYYQDMVELAKIRLEHDRAKLERVKRDQKLVDREIAKQKKKER